MPPFTLEWYSDRDGWLGTGARLTSDDLSMGRHTISLVALDDRGVFTSGAATTLTVSGPLETHCNPLGICFEKLPAGTFIMGSNPQGTAPQNGDRRHRVTFTHPLYVQSTEVTRDQWAAVTGRPLPLTAECPECPATGISWEALQAFIAQLNAIDARGYRLPTEAEWEYAARAGDTHTPPIRKKTWYRGNANGRPQPVGTRRPNAWGLYDMQGNVWEWCHDFFGEYAAGPSIDPTGPSTGTHRVVRGGSFDNALPECRPTHRNAFPPDHGGGNIGFRLVFTP